MQQTFVDLASQQPSHLLLAELLFCLEEPSPRPTLRPHVQVVDPILSLMGSAWLRLGLSINTGSGMDTVGAGHSRRLFSCLLSIPCLTSGLFPTP